MIKKTLKIIRECIPVLIMIGLIPLVESDYRLTILYIIIITISFYIKKEKRDNIFFLFGFFVMILSESVFLSTGVEVFVRNSLFGIMPLWLPFLWAYSFVVMRRALVIIN